MNPHEASLSRHPLAQLAVAFSAGICTAEYFPAQLFVLWIAGGVCAIVVVVALWQQRLSVAGVALLVAIAVAGCVLADPEKKSEKRSELGEFVGRRLIVTGVLTKPPELGTDKFYLTLSVEQLEVDGFTRSAPGVISLLAPFQYRDLELRYGTRIRVVTKLGRADSCLNPGVSPLSEYLDRKGYDATGVIHGAKNCSTRSTCGLHRRPRACSTQPCWAIATTFRARHQNAFARAARFMCS